MKLPHYLPAFLLIISTAVCSAPVRTEIDALKLATSAIRKFQLTTLKPECGSASAVERRAHFDVIVRERHSAACGGDPQTSPRLFNVRVRKHDGRLTTTAYDGVNYLPLDHDLRPGQ